MSDSEQGIQARPNLPLRSEELPWEDYTKDTKRFGDRTIPLGAHGGGTQIGFNLVELPPGKQSCPFHYHHREEEHIFILEGRCILRSGEGRYEMKAGDYVCFPAGTGVGHATLNPFPEPCRMIVAGTPRADPLEVVVYPDSGKVMLRALRKLIPWPQDGLDYNHGEKADEPL
jgi:uncharacterized cupin superfamily protein